MPVIGMFGVFERGQPFEQFLAEARAVGVEAIELFPDAQMYGGSLSFDPSGLERARRQLADAGLVVGAISGSTDFVQPTPEAVEAQVAETRRLVDLAVAFGCPVVRFFGGEPKPGVAPERQIDLMVEGFKRCVGYAEARGVYLAQENHGRITNDGDVLLEINRRVGSRQLGIAIDASNLRWFGNDLATIRRWYSELAPLVRYTHLKDGSAAAGFQRDYTALALGEGEIELRYLLERLKGAGYAGPLAIEFEGRGDRRIGIAKGVGYLRAARRWLDWA